MPEYTYKERRAEAEAWLEEHGWREPDESGLTREDRFNLQLGLTLLAEGGESSGRYQSFMNSLIRDSDPKVVGHMARIEGSFENSERNGKFKSNTSQSMKPLIERIYPSLKDEGIEKFTDDLAATYRANRGMQKEMSLSERREQAKEWIRNRNQRRELSLNWER